MSRTCWAKESTGADGGGAGGVGVGVGVGLGAGGVGVGCCGFITGYFYS